MMAAKTEHLESITKFVAAREKHPKAAMFALQAVARELLGDSRLKICYRHRIPERNVEIWHNQKRQSAYYVGLMKCGMQWVCPLCSSRLSEKRRDMLRKALDNSRDKYVPVMVTYTAQHHAGMPLAFLLGGMLEAYRSMRRARLWDTIKQEFMIVGEVRAMEITWGDQGWHPHFHVIAFLDIAILRVIAEKYPQDNAHERFDLAARIYGPLTSHLTAMWIHSLEMHGLTAQVGPALNVRGDWSTLDDYLTKSGSAMPKQAERWGVVEELTKANRKKSRGDNLNVWDLLLYHWAGEKPHGAKFVEYYEATKGKSAMKWTPGMLARLNVEDQTDQDMIDQDTDPGDLLLISLGSEQWRMILAAGAEGHLLDLASGGEYEKVAQFLSSLGAQVYD